MKLRDGETAVVDIAKLRLYCLDTTHPRGTSKARHFHGRLGMGPGDAETLQEQLLEAARKSDEVETAHRDEYGQRYEIDAEVRGPAGAATVRSTWIVRSDESPPHLVTCYVL
ncbi:MAG: DUF6883 domain-containing protein [Planctomycetota bacterium]|jgi:hypothetical protein